MILVDRENFSLSNCAFSFSQKNGCKVKSSKYYDEFKQKIILVASSLRRNIVAESKNFFELLDSFVKSSRPLLVDLLNPLRNSTELGIAPYEATANA